MKTKNILFTMLILVLSTGTIKAQDSLIKHTVHVSPFIGLNSTLEAPVYGAELGYEFRLNKKWGFTAGTNIAYTQKNYQGDNIITQNQIKKLLQNAFYGGAKYYLGQFYLSTEFGLENTYSTLLVDYDGKENTYFYDKAKSNSFYHAYGFGYQLPLKKGDNLEFFAKAANNNRNTNYVLGFRYSFGLFGKK
jgi:outer membrane receptor protein involved in Fe transport